jgi:molybdopterin/thiamine biosynthesis adenylyltransferase
MTSTRGSRARSIGTARGRGRARVLVVGVGGLGCPAALALARSGVGGIGLCDDDVVDRTNLHRQILFDDADVGSSKLDAAARALRDTGAELHLHRSRLLPQNAVSTVREYDVVVEGSDNFATKFLTADACALAGVAVVHASAVRWVGTALAVGASGRPCYRCLFEDLPVGDAPNCGDAGVMGPVAGVVAAAQVDLALALLDGSPVEGQLVTYDGRVDALRRRTVAQRTDCALCGKEATIRIIEPYRYTGDVGYVADVVPAPAG